MPRISAYLKSSHTLPEQLGWAHELIFFTCRLWPEGSALVAVLVGVAIIIFVEMYTRIKEQQLGQSVSEAQPHRSACHRVIPESSTAGFPYGAGRREHRGT